MKGRKINDTAIKARQIPDDHCVRAAFWTSMFQPQAPCFILKKMVWNPGEKDYRTDPKGVSEIAPGELIRHVLIFI